MMRQFDNADAAVSWAAVLIFFGALFPALALVSLLIRDAGSLVLPYNLLFFGGVAAQVVGAAFLLKQRRWAWPLTVAGVALQGAPDAGDLDAVETEAYDHRPITAGRPRSAPARRDGEAGTSRRPRSAG